MTDYLDHLQSVYWRRLKNEALARASYRCEGLREGVHYPGDPGPERRRCEATDCLQLHHLHYRSVGTETLTDVQILCERCHRIETVLQWRCPMCDGDVFDEGEAIAVAEQAKLLGGLFGARLTVGEWVRRLNRYCSYCDHLMNKDD